MKIKFTNKTYNIHTGFSLFALLMLYFTSVHLLQHITALNIKKNGKLLPAIVVAKHQSTRGRDYATVELPIQFEPVKKLYLDCSTIQIGDTVIVQYLHNNSIILVYDNGNITLGKYNLYTVIIEFIIVFFLFFIAITSSTWQTEADKYVLKRKKYLLRKQLPK